MILALPFSILSMASLATASGDKIECLATPFSSLFMAMVFALLSVPPGQSTLTLMLCCFSSSLNDLLKR
jgi:hypothetical protein